MPKSDKFPGGPAKAGRSTFASVPACEHKQRSTSVVRLVGCLLQLNVGSDALLLQLKQHGIWADRDQTHTACRHSRREIETETFDQAQATGHVAAAPGSFGTRQMASQQAAAVAATIVQGQGHSANPSSLQAAANYFEQVRCMRRLSLVA